MNPFQVGDVVYTVRGSKCIVKESTKGMCLLEICNEDSKCWKFWEELSFTRWPKANHERPIQDGWWIVTNKEGPITDWPTVRRKSGVDMYDTYGVTAKHSTAYTFHKFLGDSWK